MPDHRIVTMEEWKAAPDELLSLEKEHTRRGDQLTRLHQDLPWVRIEKESAFQTADGPRSLAALFDGRSQLVIYNFMFGPDYEAGCPVCSSIADSFNGVVEHLKARDVTMMCVSRAPIDKIHDYRRRMGWAFSWASSFDTDFNADFDCYVPKDTVASWFDGELPAVPAHFAADCGVADVVSYMTERPGLTVFTLADGDVYLTYSSTARGLEPVMVYYGILDRVPKGRYEGSPPSPAWIRRRDQFATSS